MCRAQGEEIVYTSTNILMIVIITVCAPVLWASLELGALIS